MEEQLQSANEIAQENPVADVIADGGVPVEEGHQEQEVQQEYAEEYDDGGYYQDPDGGQEIPEQNVESTTSQVDWQNETRKFQSMYDKSQADNQKMQEVLMRQVETQGNPQAGHQDVGAQETDIPSEDDFSPWDAYYKPNSPSWNLRTGQENERIDGAVQAHMSQLNNQMVMNNTVKELRDNYNMEEGEVRDFMEFATTPRGQLPLETLVKVWGAGKTQGQPNPTLEKVKANRNIPRTAGVLQGQAPQPARNEAQKTWDNIVNAGGGVGSKIP